MNIVAEGVDYSTYPPGGAALKAAGKQFAVRYLADDWRGIGFQNPNEIADLKANGIELAVVYESAANRMLGGYAAGAVDAVYAQNVLLRRGLPADQPIYFACDFDASPDEQAVVDDYLRACARVIGIERTGVYGGYWVIDRCVANGTARWLWQTYAWSGGRLHPAVHLYQYDNYDNTINGTDVDLNRAYQANYGQASMFDGSVIEVPAGPAWPEPILPDWYRRADKRISPSSADWRGNRWYPQRMNVEALTRTYRYTEPDIKSPHAGEPIEPNEKIAIRWTFEDETTGRQWHVNDDGYVVASKFKQLVPLPSPRRAA